MKLVILHYHLNRGGVTRVIENQLLALDAVWTSDGPLEAVVIHGGRREGWPDDLPGRLGSIRLELHETPLLDYDSVRSGGAVSTDALVARLAELLDSLRFSPDETIVHVHNHSMGKNVALPGACAALAERGHAMLLQIHDFAEDFRAANFKAIASAAGDAPNDAWHGSLYPQAARIHYAALNGRDLAILEAARIESDRLHLLPNPVPKMANLPARDAARRRLAERFGVSGEERLVLYPVRCIRRKNIGEAVLYSRLAPARTVVGMTLAPLNRAEQPIYNEWKQLVNDLKLPCRFELGEPGGLTFGENLAAADLILTTSLAEGFGMVFLEAWLAGRALVGRDLPEITSDFVAAGVCLDRLQPRLMIPGEWIGIDRFRQMFRDAYRHTLSEYGRPEPDDLEHVLDAKTADGLVDFGDLNEDLEREVITIACRGSDERRRLLDANRWIEDAFSSNVEEEVERIAQNAQAIGRHFSLEPSGRRLLEIYELALQAPRGASPRPLSAAPCILDRFLAPGRFRPIRG